MMQKGSLDSSRHRLWPSLSLLWINQLISMDQAFLQSLGANNQAESRVGFNSENPYMPSFPGIPNFVDAYEVRRNKGGVRLMATSQNQGGRIYRSKPARVL